MITNIVKTCEIELSPDELGILGAARLGKLDRAIFIYI